MLACMSAVEGAACLPKDRDEVEAMTSLDGQVVVVTGAASGIGLGIGRGFHDAGASVVLGDVRQDALD